MKELNRNIRKMWKNKCLVMIQSTAPSPIGEGDGG
jgi:hypothetical protein